MSRIRTSFALALFPLLVACVGPLPTPAPFTWVPEAAPGGEARTLSFALHGGALFLGTQNPSATGTGGFRAAYHPSRRVTFGVDGFSTVPFVIESGRAFIKLNPGTDHVAIIHGIGGG